MPGWRESLALVGLVGKWSDPARPTIRFDDQVLLAAAVAARPSDAALAWAGGPMCDRSAKREDGQQYRAADASCLHPTETGVGVVAIGPRRDGAAVSPNLERSINASRRSRTSGDGPDDSR